MKTLMGCTHSSFSPASRFRFLQYVPALEQAGWKVLHRPCRPGRPLPRPSRFRPIRALQQLAAPPIRRFHRRRDIREASSVDVVFLNRDLMAGGLRWEQRLFEDNPRVVYDFDDAIYLGHNERRIEWMCQHAAWVTPGNETLARFARRFTDRVTVLPTVVDVDRYAVASDRMPARAVCVGWCGSDLSIRETLFPFVPLLGRLQAEIGFDFVVVSNPRPSLPESRLQWTFKQWSETTERSLGSFMDIGIMPLVDNPMQRGKCGAKILQYMASGLPSIASPVGINSNIVEHGVNGLLADNDEQWRTALASLVQNAQKRREFGRAGRRHCEKTYDLQVWLPVLLDVLHRVSEMK